MARIGRRNYRLSFYSRNKGDPDHRPEEADEGRQVRDDRCTQGVLPMLRKPTNPCDRVRRIIHLQPSPRRDLRLPSGPVLGVILGMSGKPLRLTTAAAKWCWLVYHKPRLMARSRKSPLKVPRPIIALTPCVGLGTLSILSSTGQATNQGLVWSRGTLP